MMHDDAFVTFFSGGVVANIAKNIDNHYLISENDKTTLVAEKEGGLGCGNALVHIRTHHWIFQR